MTNLVNVSLIVFAQCPGNDTMMPSRTPPQPPAQPVWWTTFFPTYYNTQWQFLPRVEKNLLTILHGLTSKFSIMAQCDKQKFYFLNFSKFSHPMILIFSLIRSPEHILQDCVDRICGHFSTLGFIQQHCALLCSSIF